MEVGCVTRHIGATPLRQNVNPASNDMRHASVVDRMMHDNEKEKPLLHNTIDYNPSESSSSLISISIIELSDSNK